MLRRVVLCIWQCLIKVFSNSELVHSTVPQMRSLVPKTKTKIFVWKLMIPSLLPKEKTQIVTTGWAHSSHWLNHKSMFSSFWFCLVVKSNNIVYIAGNVCLHAAPLGNFCSSLNSNIAAFFSWKTVFRWIHSLYMDANLFRNWNSNFSDQQDPRDCNYFLKIHLD